jgi:hypothetical protein
MKMEPGIRDTSKLSTRERLFQVASDMRRDPSLSFYRAAAERGVSPRSRYHHLKNLFYRGSDGRIRPRKSDRYRQTLFIPTAQPGAYMAIRTKDSHERSLLGQWLAAINAAAQGDFSKINEFPKNQVVDGVRLATSPEEVQRIVEAMAESDDRFEGPYRGKVTRG